ncbi:MAG: histidine kinase dimerization/phospho-acceptor domain-containing protein [Oscillospiraceae bacterium]|nr:histidine kinase dimerization/phospho-acceptor domain-containing protein [Oscillospiraceae bacterium]
MKNHIAFKFLAVLLASLFLLSAAVSAAGIIALAALDLDPGQTVEQRFEEEMEHRWSSSADDIARRYASLTLGNAPERLVDNWYGRWYNNYPGIQGYRLEDADGNLLESEGTPEDGTACTYTVVTEYMQVTGAGPEDSTEAPEETLPETSPDGQVRTEETVPTETAAEEDAPDTAPETGTDEATIPPEEALPEQMDDAVEATLITEPVWEEADGNTYYYQDENGKMLGYTWEQAPEYRVTVYVSREYADMNRNPAWQLVGLVYTWRTQLMVGLGVSLLVFALLAVYLCCAAGRKPGTDVVRAGGLNRIPLDLYAFLVVLGVGCIGVVFVEEADYLLELERTLALTIVGYGGYCCALMIVGFCFAFAAQVKTPEYFWWRNSLCGRVFSLFILACRWCWKQWLRVWHWLPKAVRWVWNLAARIFRACWKLVLWTWNLVMGILGTVWGFVARWGKACGRSLSRMYGMLPLVWQWLVAIPLLFFLLLINIGSASPAGILLRMGIVLLATVYLASAFGTLLAGARRMCDGDMGTKVDDKMLVGCFREFADSLNGLSDAALVAAREQLKSERMRTELITNVSHDIKTPLTSIINYVDLLQYPHTPEQEKEYLAVLSRQSARMKKLIDDLMEMSKAASGSLPVEITQVDAGEAINQALGEFADKLAAADLTPVFRQPEEPILMMADGRLAWRAMSNLLSNAVKYALPGTRLYIDLSRAGSSVMISMKNISREQLNVSADELMERFVRGDTSRNTEGSGLGLNIAKSLMELQKGQLQLLVDGDLFKATLIFPGV